jgi:hypothetical protein
MPLTYPIPATVSRAIAASREATPDDDGVLLVNATANPLTLTVEAGLPVDFGCALVQISTGTVAFAAGDGVTFIGGTLVTSGAGDTATLRYVAPDTYVVKVI